MEFGKKRVFKQEEQPLRICGKNWVWFDPVLNVLISHVGHAAFTLCHFEAILGVLPSEGCCTAHALAVHWTHIFFPMSNRHKGLCLTLQPLPWPCRRRWTALWEHLSSDPVPLLWAAAPSIPIYSVTHGTSVSSIRAHQPALSLNTTVFNTPGIYSLFTLSLPP